ncbi:uncharacterized protein LOC111832198 [Capsella rubella]|uniref:uncharacterized protein LOC111832198 n=1 Tax=Capsella rubella TaxID=81985 RepID=UPI000CD588B2|nr:uncharacterized protein LOC111832198 [Capsella rubella]
MKSIFSGIQKLVSSQSPEPVASPPEQQIPTEMQSPTDEEQVPSQEVESMDQMNQSVPYSVTLPDSEAQDLEKPESPKSPTTVDGDCDSYVNTQRSQPAERNEPNRVMEIEDLSDGSDSVQVTGTTGPSVSFRVLKRKQLAAMPSEQKKRRQAIRGKGVAVKGEPSLEFDQTRFGSAVAFQRYGSFLSRKLHAEVNTTFGEIDEVKDLIAAARLLRTVSESKPFDSQVVYEFWANLPSVEPETESMDVLIRNWVYEFTFDRINALFGLASVDERTEQRHMAEVITSDIALFVSGGKAKVFKQFQLSKVEDNNTKDLLKICCTNWLPTTNDGYVTPDRAKLVYKVMHQKPFDFGRMVLKLIINMGVTPVSKLCLPFPSLIYQLIQSQHPVHPDVSQPVPKSTKKGKAKKGQTAEVPVYSSDDRKALRRAIQIMQRIIDAGLIDLWGSICPGEQLLLLLFAFGC